MLWYKNTHTKKCSESFSGTIGVSEGGLARMAQVQRNIWFEKRKDKSLGDEIPLIPGQPNDHP